MPTSLDEESDCASIDKVEESRVPKGDREDSMSDEVLVDCSSEDTKFCKFKLEDKGAAVVPLYEGSKSRSVVKTSCASWMRSTRTSTKSILMNRSC